MNPFEEIRNVIGIINKTKMNIETTDLEYFEIDKLKELAIAVKNYLKLQIKQLQICMIMKFYKSIILLKFGGWEVSKVLEGRVEQHIISRYHPMYKICDDYCKRSKNLLG